MVWSDDEREALHFRVHNDELTRADLSDSFLYNSSATAV